VRAAKQTSGHLQATFDPNGKGRLIVVPVKHQAVLGRSCDSDDRLAAELAVAGGKTLLAVRASGLFSAGELGQTGDAMSHVLLSRALDVHRPGDVVLSEEADADPPRLDAERVWIIDPLDGSREYADGRADWAVHVALSVDGVPGACAVALPALGRVMSTAHNPRLRDRDPGQLRIAVSRTRPPELAERVAHRLRGKLVLMGSAGFKAMAVLTGAADAYLHAGGQYEWDSAAPVGVAVAAGLHASRIDGSPLIYNRPDPELPDLLICRPELAGALLGAVEAARGADW
jgi:3'(2'), 5'-bisphosphate nucleotidase